MTVCAACPHLRTAHALPSGACLLCRPGACPGWTEPDNMEEDA